MTVSLRKLIWSYIFACTYYVPVYVYVSYYEIFFLAKLIFLIINKEITWDVSRNKTKLSGTLNYTKLYSEFYVNLSPAVFGITLNWRLEMHISELLETRCVLKATVYYVIMSMFIKIYSSRGERPVPKFLLYVLL